jgi:probable F420-dependent oxidoreductase
MDVLLPPGIGAAAESAVRAESLGFDGIWALETQSDPFQDLAGPALQTSSAELGTAVAIAFARSPFVTAMNAWQLQAASRGRFILGLGTEVKGHIERRFGMAWESPGPKLREHVQAVRALWRGFQRQERLNFRGRFYTHTLQIPFFDPGPIDYPAPPIYLAAFNPYNCVTVGLLADGIVVHPVHTVSYLNEIMFPAINKGLRRSGRQRSDLSVMCMIFVIAGDSAERRAAEDFVRSYIAFQGATRTYHGIFDHHGWSSIPGKLHELLATGNTEAMSHLITDEMVDLFAIRAANDDEVAERILDRYGGVADRICIFNLLSTAFGRDPDRLTAVVRAVQAGVSVMV